MEKMLATVHVSSITGRPRWFYGLEVIGVRVRLDRLATTMSAVETIIVPWPPKPAPKASAHHNGWMSIPYQHP